MLLRRTSRIRLSFVRFCFVCVCVIFFSFVRSPTFVLLVRRMCVCLCGCVSFNFHFLLLLLLFFSGASQCFKRCPSCTHLVSSFFNVVIRGGVFLHFFCYSNKTHTHVHTYTGTHTHTQTDGRKSARAPLVLGRQHTQNYFAFFLLLCVIAIITIGCCCYSLFMGCFFFFFALLIKTEKECTHTLLKRGELYTIFQLFRDALFGNLLLLLQRLLFA